MKILVDMNLRFQRLRKIMNQVLTVALCFVVCASTALAQKTERQVNGDPDKVKFVTSDIDNFWRAFDLASKESDVSKKINVYQTEYLDKGSVGLQDFVRLRIKSAKDLVETIENLPRYYASVRPSTLRVREMETEMRRSFRKFKEIYPAAVFPDVYFVIGITNTGGTASKNGLLIGTELYGLTKDTPREEFPAYFKSVSPSAPTDEKQLQAIVDRLLATALKPIEQVPPTVAHESVHFNQNYAEGKTLLRQSILEGAGDFLGEMIAGELMNPLRQVYGDKHEAELWREFQVEMNGTNTKNWLYNGMTAKDRPFDLGYYMGYKICESYYKNAADKQQAIRDILGIKDFPAFLEKSRYREKFEK